MNYDYKKVKKGVDLWITEAWYVSA